MYVGFLLPNFFIVYFGQKPPIGDITSEDVNMAFSNVGMGYKTWCTFAEVTINASYKIEKVLESAETKDAYSHVVFVKKYFNQHWKGNGIQVATTGPTNAIISVISGSFPAEAAEINSVFGSATSPHCWVPKFGHLHHPTPS